MDYYSTAIFYFALLLIIGGVAELYVRIKGLGERADKVRGVLTAKKPKLGPPLVLLIAAIVVAAATFPH